jgi:hypothetical protein
MKLDDFEQRGDNGHPRFVTQVQDVSGDEKFELTLAGPEALVRQVLADATIELTIDSAQSEDDIKRRFDELSAQQRKQMWSLADLEKVDDLFKPEPAWPQGDTSVLAAVRPVRGGRDSIRDHRLVVHGAHGSELLLLRLIRRLHDRHRVASHR